MFFVAPSVAHGPQSRFYPKSLYHPPHPVFLAERVAWRFPIVRASNEGVFDCALREHRELPGQPTSFLLLPGG